MIRKVLMFIGLTLMLPVIVLFLIPISAWENFSGVATEGTDD